MPEPRNSKHKRPAVLPAPLHIPRDSEEIAEDAISEVAEAIEDVDLPERQQPFSPSAVGRSLSRLGTEAAHGREVRGELLSPEAKAKIPRPT